MFDHGGWDLLDWFRGRRPWPQLVRIVNQLPPLSRFRRAVADDDDLNWETSPSGERRRPTLDQWTEADELRATLVDGFTLVQLAIASKDLPQGKKPPKFKPAPRPVTARERATKRAAEAMHREIVAAVLPSTR